MQKLGLSTGTYAAFILALSIALAFLCFTLGAVIFWRRSDDWMVLLGALAVVASVTLNENVYGMDMNSAWGWLAMVMLVLGNGVYLLLLSLFPDGRFVTRWASWLLLCWAVAVIPYFMFMSFMSSPFYTLIWLSAIGLVMIAQVYRYRTVSSPLQRQQVKWFIFGGCVAVIIGIGLTVLPFIFPALGQAGSFYQLVITPVYNRTLVHRPALYWHCHSALPALGHRYHHSPHAGLQHLDGFAGCDLRSQRVHTPILYQRSYLHTGKPTGDYRFHVFDWGAVQATA